MPTHVKMIYQLEELDDRCLGSMAKQFLKQTHTQICYTTLTKLEKAKLEGLFVFHFAEEVLCSGQS